MSLMKYNNLSFLTYGALGLTGLALAIATVYEASGPSSEPAATESDSGSPISEMISSATEPISDTFSSKPAEGPGLFGESNSKPGMFTGGKKHKKRRTKKHNGSNPHEKQSGKTKHRKSKLQKKAKQQSDK
jgi:hypothetical protein